MKAESLPLAGNSLVFYPEIQDYLDRRYGGPGKENPSKANGEAILRNILQFLSVNKNSTCPEIAKSQFDSEITGRAKLKSITDDVRKFLKGTLIPLTIVEISGTKKEYNKNVKQFSLTPFGVLYTIHLFTLTKEGKVPDYDSFDDYDLIMIRNLAKEYGFLLPKVFGRFSVFENIIGKNFEYTLGLLRINDQFSGAALPLDTDLLNESIEFLYLVKSRQKKPIRDMQADEISFLVYNNLLGNIEIYKTESLKQTRKLKGKSLGKLFKKAQRDARTKWKKIIKSDPKIKTWYYDFINSAIKHYRIKIAEIIKLQSLLIKN